MLEIIATTVGDAKQVEKGGAGRIELISAYGEGGLTPSAGMIEAVVKSVKIPVNVMIRPHSRSYCYSPDDLAVMEKDIAVAKQCGANGVVLGILTEDNQICEASLQRLLPHCKGLDVTFHRAIDEMDDPAAAIELLAKYPEITNVLTSGGVRQSIDENLPVLQEMMRRCGHIRLMIGSGLSKDNLARIMKTVGAFQCHLGSAVRKNHCGTEEIELSALREIAAIEKSCHAN